LGVLTAKAFLELRSPPADAPGRPPALDPPPEVPAEKDPRTLEAENPLAAGLVEADPLVGETLPGLTALPAESCLKPLKDTWPQWVAARQLVRRSLRVQREVEAVDAARSSEAASKLDALRAEYEKMKPEQAEGMVALLDRQIDAIRQRALRAAQQAKADALLAEARSAYGSGDYAKCVPLCDQWLTEHAALDAVSASRMRVLRERAGFYVEASQMSVRWKEADSPAARKALIEGFLAKYGSSASLSSRQQEILGTCRSRLASLEEEIQTSQINQQAEQAVARLTENPPPKLADRLQAAAEVRQSYPTTEVARRLRRAARAWLVVLLPDKELPEDEELKEVETRQGQILRGYFREVHSSATTGYKFYASRQEYIRPTVQVGAYGSEQLLGEPGAPLPRQCVARYRQLRSQVLQSPEQKEGWERLAGTCEKFEELLSAYRGKPGSSREPLSFAPEAAAVRQLVADPVWTHVEKVFRP
jgi:hypothetical protein